MKTTFVTLVFAVSLGLAGSACYVESQPATYRTTYQPTASYGTAPTTVVDTNYYRPLYYQGYVVYYDTYGRPYYYLNGAQYYIPSTYHYYNYYTWHYNRYRTHYYHLSGIRKGVRRGVWVTQARVIGYVGTTGRSTGPHLHYGMQRSGRFINPLRLNSPSRNPVAKNDIDRFRRTSAIIFTLFDIGRNRILDPDLKQWLYRAGIMFLGDQV